MTATVLFIHGFLDDATVWDGVIAVLASAVDVIQYDLPGSGTRSPAVADLDTVTLESLAAEAGDIVAGIDAPVIVVGHSMGSQVAELVAASHADRVQGLVLVTPVPLGGTQLPAEELAPFRALGGDTDAQRTLRSQVSPNLAADQLDRLVHIGGAVRPDVAARYADMWNEGVSNAPTTSAFTGPVLIIRGGADAFVTEQLLAATTSRFVQPNVKVIDKGGHWLHVEYPEALATTILGFTEPITRVTA
ncbi:MAG TPA: alpha/beta hydrolase [Mycobacterium sp.]|jgi:esterase